MKTLNSNLVWEIQTVKLLGEKIGYGHLMQLASTLWGNDLESHGYPRNGAFIPTTFTLLSEEGKKIALSEDAHYRNLIDCVGADE